MKLGFCQHQVGTGRGKLIGPFFAVWVAIELRLDHVDHNIVADKTALVHDLLSLPPKRGLLCDLRAQHVTSSLGVCKDAEE